MLADCRPTRKRKSLMKLSDLYEDLSASICCADSYNGDYHHYIDHNHNHHINLKAATTTKTTNLNKVFTDCEKRSQTTRIKEGKMRTIIYSQKLEYPDTNRLFKVITSFLMILNVLVRMTNAAMSLPDGIENILGFVPRSTFQCERDGYFGDIDNDCRIFHLCQKQVHPNGRTEWRHWTYACGNQTMFNQLTLTCAFVDEAIPCKHASQFQYLNEVIHKPKEPFLTDADVTSGVSYYSNRIMSDGARNRAFEDSRLMAQLGGQEMFNSVQASFQRNRNQAHRQPRQDFNPTSAEQASSSSNRLQQFGNNNNGLNAASMVLVSDLEESNPQQVGNSIEHQRQPIDQPFGSDSSSLNDVFERASNGGFEFQQAGIQSKQNEPSGGTTSELIINHRQHFEHSANQFEPASNQQHVFQPTSQHEQVVQTKNLFANAAQLPPQPQATGGPHAFDFSISTNHRLDRPSNKPLQHWAPFNPDHQPAERLPTTAPPAQPIETTTSSRQSQQTPTPSSIFAPDRLASGTLAPGNEPRILATMQPQQAGAAAAATATAATSTTITTTTTIASTTTPSSVDSRPATTTSAQHTLDPPTTSNSATTTSRVITTTTNANTSTERNQSSQLRRRQTSQPRELTQAAQRNNQTNRVASNRQQQQQQQQRQKQDHQNQLLFQHMHSNFQSTRLSATQKRAQQESSVVMRQHVQSSGPLADQLSQPKPAQASIANQALPIVSSLETSSGDFWRRPFVAQLFAPRFESLLTRRRV